MTGVLDHADLVGLEGEGVAVGVRDGLARNPPFLLVVNATPNHQLAEGVEEPLVSAHVVEVVMREPELGDLHALPLGRREHGRVLRRVDDGRVVGALVDHQVGVIVVEAGDRDDAHGHRVEHRRGVRQPCFAPRARSGVRLRP